MIDQRSPGSSLCRKFCILTDWCVQWTPRGPWWPPSPRTGTRPGPPGGTGGGTGTPRSGESCRSIHIQDFHLQKSLLNPADSSGRMSRRKSETVIQVPGGKEGRREERREPRSRARRLSDPSQVETVASSLNSLTLGEKTLTCRHHQDGNAGKSVSWCHPRIPTVSEELHIKSFWIVSILWVFCGALILLTKNSKKDRVALSWIFWGEYFRRTEHFPERCERGDQLGNWS